MGKTHEAVYFWFKGSIPWPGIKSDSFIPRGNEKGILPLSLQGPPGDLKTPKILRLHYETQSQPGPFLEVAQMGPPRVCPPLKSPKGRGPPVDGGGELELSPLKPPPEPFLTAPRPPLKKSLLADSKFPFSRAKRRNPQPLLQGQILPSSGGPLWARVGSMPNPGALEANPIKGCRARVQHPQPPGPPSPGAKNGPTQGKKRGRLSRAQRNKPGWVTIPPHGPWCTKAPFGLIPPGDPPSIPLSANTLIPRSRRAFRALFRPGSPTVSEPDHQSPKSHFSPLIKSNRPYTLLSEPNNP
ncbi:proline-rich protein 2-like [Penaeus monodon]|uniref:proline-rich protein 2-like n=1 Tax=Penaeus monodon TaxID=6687 RepID=UPI0018A72447|nr:proline-rich protein 2-like [Penaeus monodon]